MRNHPFDSAESLPPSLVQQIDECCDRFETLWKQGGDCPRIEDYVDDAQFAADGTARRRLLIELVMVDLEYRWSRTRRDAPSAERVAGEDGTDLAGSACLPPRPCLEDYVLAFRDLCMGEPLPSELVDHERRVRLEWEESKNSL